MKLIYIAGKLNDDAVGYIKNVHLMITESEIVRRAGFAVAVPAFDMLSGIVYGDLEYEDYFNNNQETLKRCDAVYVCPNWPTSKGTQREMALAESLNIPVCMTLEELEALE